MPESAPAATPHDTNIVETIQSLIVAFVLAMTFRGFVTEGFVIPTGSMAPTLLGQHALIHSQQTGWRFTVGMDQAVDPRQIPFNQVIADPMLGEQFPGTGAPSVLRPKAMGDRILVLKTLYPFSEPDRFDVVVFKNPTDPLGDAANYIKRLIGLPNEQVWITDGDVFARPLTFDADGRFAVATPSNYSDFKIQRKPEHVQRAVWQPVHHSDFAPVHPQRLSDRRTYEGPPWAGDRAIWTLSADARAFQSNTDQPAMLVWENTRRQINDWLPYNMLSAPVPASIPVSDIRVTAGLVRSVANLNTTLELEANSHLYRFTIRETSPRQADVSVSMKPLTLADRENHWRTERATVKLPAAGNVFNVEFWHADQSMKVFIDGSPVVHLDYDWSPLDRLQFSTGDLQNETIDSLMARTPRPAQLRWRFEGSPVTLHRVNVDRDLYYRGDLSRFDYQRNGPNISGRAFGTHPVSPAQYPGVLGPDQFMMCGDNSQKSLDSRFWGNPHPLVANQVDDSPFTVHRRLLIGKAWVVYFPAPFPIKTGGPSVVPDFGQLRFIR